MTMLRQLTWGLLATGVLTLTACSEEAVAPTPTATGGDMLAAKGGGGGGGGGKPGNGTPADPAIAFTASPNCGPASGGGLWVVNGDGSNQSDIQCDSPLGESAWHPAWSPEGRSIAFYHIATHRLVVVDVALDAQGRPTSQNPRVLASDATSTYNPTWSPSGDLIAYSNGSQAIYTIPATGGPQTVVCQGCGEDPTWSADGSQLAVGFGGALQTVTVSTGAIQTLIPEGEFERIFDPDWSRSGDRIAFDGTPLAGGPRGTYIFDLGTGSYSLLTDQGYPASWSPDDQELVVNNRVQQRSQGGLRVVNALTGATVRTLAKGGAAWLDWRRCAPGPGCGPGN